MMGNTTWTTYAKTQLQLPRANGINLATVCLDDHPAQVMSRPALVWEGANQQQEIYTFSELSARSNQWANVLQGLGVKATDRVFLFLERIPELYIAFFGALKIQAIVSPLFSAFGPDALLDRLQDSGASVIVTSPSLKPRIDSILSQLPQLKTMVVVNREQAKTSVTEHATGIALYDWHSLMAQASTQFTVPDTHPNTPSIMHYTSGTTGKPKGVLHQHGSIITQAATAQSVLDLKPSDIYWCTADPGWVTGTSYGMFGPWALGITQVVYGPGFEASAWYSVLERYKVSVWYTAPTAIRMLMKAGNGLPGEFNLSALRHLCSVGEPLNPEAIVWGRQVFNGLSFHDTWWQTETGAMHIVNRPGLAIEPGSMGKPIEGVQAAILSDDYTPLPENTEGHLAVTPDAPSFFKTYWGKEDVYASRFRTAPDGTRWYLTGDRARCDSNGYYWFVGRADDVINTAGHLVGPFEVESALVEHPAVAEAGVIGVPDAERLEVVKAYVSLCAGYEPSEALKNDIQQFVRQRLAAHAYPRQLEFVASLPKTRSGKIMRRLLKARALGLPEGDVSTLED